MKKGDLAKLLIRLEAEIGRYSRDMERARKDTRKWRTNVKKDVGLVKKAFAGFVGFIATKRMASFYKTHADGIDRLAKNSKKLGGTTEALQGLYHAGELTNVSVQTMNMALQRQNRRIAEAANGYGEARGALKELGLDAEKLIKLPVDQQFMHIAQAMEQVTNVGDRTRLTMKLFDSEGVALVNTLGLGVDGLKAARAEVEGFGGAISNVEAAQVEAANDEFSRTGLVLQAVGTRIAYETAPLVGAIANEFLNSAKEAGGMGNIARRSVDGIVTGVGIAANVVHGLKVVWLGARQAVAEFFAVVTEGFAFMSGLQGSLLSKLGFDTSVFDGIQEFADSFRQTTNAMREELNSELMSPMPKDKIDSWVEDIRVKSQAAARESVAKNGGLSALLMGDGAFNESGAGVEKENDRLASITSIRDRWRKSELSREMNFQAKIIDFQEYSSKRKAKTLLSEGVQITQGAAHTNKRLFKMNKVMALADAAVTLPSAVLKAVERGGGWPWGAGFGALTLSNGLAQISAIKRAEFGGGASASLAGIGGGATLVADVAPPDLTAANDAAEGDDVRGSLNIYFQGDIYEMDDFHQRVVDAVAEASDRNSLVIRDSSGRQTLEVA